MKHYICKCGADGHLFIASYPRRTYYGMECLKCDLTIDATHTIAEAELEWLGEGCRIESK